MTDHITLPRAVVEQALEALDSDNPDIQLRAAIELRCAFIRAMLAKPVQEPFDREAELDRIQRIADQPDLERCQLCGGPADNGFDRCYPQNSPMCSRCARA